MEFFFRKKSHNAEKTERGTIWDFSNTILSKNIKKLKVGPFDEKKICGKKVSQSRKYSLAPLSFLNDIKILLRKLRIVRN